MPQGRNAISAAGHQLLICPKPLCCCSLPSLGVLSWAQWCFTRCLLATSRWTAPSGTPRARSLARPRNVSWLHMACHSHAQQCAHPIHVCGSVLQSRGRRAALSTRTKSDDDGQAAASACRLSEFLRDPELKATKSGFVTCSPLLCQHLNHLAPDGSECGPWELGLTRHARKKRTFKKLLITHRLSESHLEPFASFATALQSPSRLSETVKSPKMGSDAETKDLLTKVGVPQS